MQGKSVKHYEFFFEAEGWPEFLDAHPEYRTVPDWFIWDLQPYILDGIRPAEDISVALIGADLHGIMAHGDDHTLAVLRPIYKLMYNHIPSQSWKSREAMEAWIAGGGWRGRQRQEA